MEIIQNNDWKLTIDLNGGRIRELKYKNEIGYLDKKPSLTKAGFLYLGRLIGAGFIPTPSLHKRKALICKAV